MQNGGVVGSETPRPAARVICRRCRVGEITYATGVCPLCGFSPAAGASDKDALPPLLEESVRRELSEEMRIERPLGRGGMSVVYLARELELGRMVAVKVLPLQLSMGPDATERFKREAKIGASLDHPHIVPVHRIGTTPTFVWYSMRWVKGGSLRDRLNQAGPMSLSDCLRVLEPVAAALHYAHRRGVVHRDVKPANILIDESGWIGICDFGIAKMFGSTPLTNTGATVGTPGYMAPEQCYGRPLDGRSDQYSLAILTFECLTGAVPFTGDSLGEIVRKHCMEPPPRVTDLRPDIPPEVADGLARALSKQPQERFESVLDLVRALGGDPGRNSLSVVSSPGATASEPTPPASAPRRRSLVAFAWIPLVLAAVVLGGLAILSRNQSPSATATPASVILEEPPVLIQPGKLWVSSTPWGELYIDGHRIGATPAMEVPLTPGRHHLQITRQGYDPYESDIEIAGGDNLRLTEIVLKPIPSR